MTERKVSSERVSEERLRAMLAGLDGVTPGPRHVYRDTLSKAIYVTDDAGNTMALFSPMEDDHRADAANAGQFASCDDEAIRAIISELLALRSSVKTVDEELLIDNAATASQNQTLIDDPVTREAIKLNIINPLLSSVKTGTRVKDLEWELMGGDSWRAPALSFGSFRVESYAEGYIVLWSAPGIADTFVVGRWPNAESAKSAAQADYERRILSAIEAPAAEGKDHPRLKTVRAHKHTCSNVQRGSTFADKCDCGALDTAGNAIEITRPSPAAVSEVTEAMVERLFTEMDRRMGLPKHIHQEPNSDWLPVDDTQIGVEFAVEFLTAALKGDRP